MTMKKTLMISATLGQYLHRRRGAGLKSDPAGEPVTTMNEMEIAAAYLQPIDMGAARHGAAGSEVGYPSGSGYSRGRRR